MNSRLIFPAAFAILVGLGMIGQWTVSYLSKKIPELETEPVRILFHLAAEFITALALILGGIGLLGNWGWGVPLYLIAIGMLFYTAVVSPGYFAQQGQLAWIGIFGILIVLAVASVFIII